MDDSQSSVGGVQGRQKRVLPSRTRRGGPGIGTCDVDLMIFDHLQRKPENEPLIPADTVVLLTTNSKYGEKNGIDGDNSISLNIVSNDKYFSRPEVIRACREQSIIQTPQWENIGDSHRVGSRLRVRGGEEDVAETSDAAYERRHKKFEAFEKRHRLREKEKLKHEQYKIKERIEQLRAMDASAFMVLPAEYFSPVSKDDALDGIDETVVSSPYTPIHGLATHTEGERRRKEMLDIATMLEQRNRDLIDLDRFRKANEAALTEPVAPVDEPLTPIERPPQPTIKLKLPARSSASITPVASPAPRSSPTKPPIKRPRQSKYPGVHTFPAASLASPSTSTSVPQHHPQTNSIQASFHFYNPPDTTLTPSRTATQSPPFPPSSLLSEPLSPTPPPEGRLQSPVAVEVEAQPTPKPPEVESQPPASPDGLTKVEEIIHDLQQNSPYAPEPEPEPEPSTLPEPAVPPTVTTNVPLLGVEDYQSGSSDDGTEDLPVLPQRPPQAEALTTPPAIVTPYVRLGANDVDEELDVVGYGDVGHAEPAVVHADVEDLRLRLQTTGMDDTPEEPSPQAGPSSLPAVESLPGLVTPDIEVNDRPPLRKKARLSRKSALNAARTPSLAPSEVTSSAPRRRAAPKAKGVGKGTEFINSQGEKEVTTAQIIITALRTQSAKITKSHRNTMAFGVKVPECVDWELLYELPENYFRATSTPESDHREFRSERTPEIYQPLDPLGEELPHESRGTRVSDIHGVNGGYDDRERSFGEGSERKYFPQPPIEEGGISTEGTSETSTHAFTGSTVTLPPGRHRDQPPKHPGSVVLSAGERTSENQDIMIDIEHFGENEEHRQPITVKRGKTPRASAAAPYDLELETILPGTEEITPKSKRARRKRDDTMADDYIPRDSPIGGEVADLGDADAATKKRRVGRPRKTDIVQTESKPRRGQKSVSVEAPPLPPELESSTHELGPEEEEEM